MTGGGGGGLQYGGGAGGHTGLSSQANGVLPLTVLHGEGTVGESWNLFVSVLSVLLLGGPESKVIQIL